VFSADVSLKWAALAGDRFVAVSYREFGKHGAMRHSVNYGNPRDDARIGACKQRA
jgi:hypothetical protein